MPDFNDILKKIDASISKFNKGIPTIQKNVLDGILEELRKLDLRSGKIKPTVANLRLIASVKNKLQRLILTDDYISEVKDFAKAFNEITALQNDYWKSVEKTFKPKTLLKEIKKQSITDTVNKLTEAGIGVTIENQVSDILRTNITAGGSYRSLESQLRELLTNTKKSDGALLKYTKQISSDAITQFSAQYTQNVSSDLGFEWFAYAGSDITTTRPFCDAMTDIRYFHVSQIPALLRAEGLTYENKKTGNREQVPIYKKTGLPHGMIDGTNAGNFFIRRGGYNCQHQIRPVSESLVPKEIKEKVAAMTPAQDNLKNFQTETGVKHNASAGLKQNIGSLELYQSKGGQPIPQRSKLHTQITREILEHGSTKTGTVYMLGGAPANGKSTLVNSGKLPHPKGILKIDSDEIKGKIPEYNHLTKEGDSRAAAFVHEESSLLGKQIAQQALDKNYDLLSDGVGDGTFKDLSNKLLKYRAAGKRIRADYVTLDTNLSIKLARDRAIKTGRAVPEKYILDMNREISKLVPRLIKNNSFDELFLWDTNINGNPRLILSQVNGKLTIYDKDLYKKFLQKSKHG